jgi:hypothetical protein
MKSFGLPPLSSENENLWTKIYTNKGNLNTTQF